MTYNLLASTTLTSSASSVAFSSIDQSYGDLVLVVNAAKNDGGGDAIKMRFNGDTGSNYSTILMEGNGSSAFSDSLTGQTSTWDSYNVPVWAGSTKAMGTYQLLDYSATDKHKSLLTRSGRGDRGAIATVSRWANTSAVTTWLIYYGNPAAEFSIGSTFNLYGVAK
jgi:hypothetical protein